MTEKKEQNLGDIWNKAIPSKSKKEEIDPLIHEKIKRRKAKHIIGNPPEFTASREILGNIIIEGMKTSGGTDVDWLVEHRGKFIILEIKSFSDDRIRIPVAQMIAYENLHKKLNENGKCYLYIIGIDDTKFMVDSDAVWIFEMSEWNRDAIPHVENNMIDHNYGGRTRRAYIVERVQMTEITVDMLSNIIESAWIEFENK